MKKSRLFLSFMLALCSIFLFACQNTPQIASFKLGTMAGSSNNTFTVSFQDDKRYEKKYYDILVKSNKENLKITFQEELKEDEYEIVFEESERWYSLTTFLVNAKNNPDTEDFISFKDAISETYIVKSNEDAKLKFKVVSGDKFKNYKDTGYLLANQENVSKEFELKVKANENK